MCGFGGDGNGNGGDAEVGSVCVERSRRRRRRRRNRRTTSADEERERDEAILCSLGGADPEGDLDAAADDDRCLPLCARACPSLFCCCDLFRCGDGVGGRQGDEGAAGALELGLVDLENLNARRRGGEKRREEKRRE